MAARDQAGLTDRLFSSALNRLFAGARPQQLEDGPQITFAALVYAASRHKDVARTGRSVVYDLFGHVSPDEFEAAVGPLGEPGPDSPLSDEVKACLDDAFAVRRRTGGKDPFIGVRHLIFAMFTSRAQPIAEARQALFFRLKVSEEAAARSIASYCRRFREQAEDPEAWQIIFNERGIELPAEAPLSPPDKAETEVPPVRKEKAPKRPARPSKVFDVEAGGAGAQDAPDIVQATANLTDPERRPEVPMLQADDPWSASVEDQSGARSEAEAFAAMVTATEFKPPLAVGIFGDWGSGKSFFMRLLHDAVDERARQAARDAEAGTAPTEGVRFFSKVVQIRFNAWHYAETNLWASLVDHVFVCLDKWAEKQNRGNEADLLFDRLATARRLTVEAAEQLVALRSEHAQATARRDEAAAALESRRIELESSAGTYFRAAWDRAVAGVGGSDAARAAARRLGLAPLAGEVSDTAASLRALGAELARMPVRRRVAVPIAAAGLAIAVAVAGAVAFWLQQRSEPLWPTLAWAVSALTAVAAPALIWARIVAKRSVAAIRDFHGAVEKQLQKELAGETEAKVTAERRLQSAEAAAAEAEERLRRAASDAADAAHEYHSNSGKGRALDFIRARLAKGDYAKHLGFIATVRRDFEELSARMRPVPPSETAEDRELHKAHVERLIESARKEGGLLDAAEIEKLRGTLAEPGGQDPVFERIILYIDDLDRCQPHQVVKVLQAIHLLLTFPLFVVFVAVDVRWLRHALARQYAGQVAGTESGAGAGATASASDYLEKIFQIPYWVRPIGVEGTRAILQSRMGGPESDQGDGVSRSDGRGGDTQPSRPLESGAQAEREQGGTKGKTEGRDPTGTRPPASQAPSQQPRPGTLSLRLTGDERKFIHDSAALLDGSPRRTLRFLNTYRIIKGSLPPSEAIRLERGGYRALLTMLSIAVSIDDCYPSLLQALADGSGSPINILRFAFQQEEFGAFEDRSRVQRAIDLFARAGDEDDLPFYARLAARYSFNPEVRLLVAAPVDEPPPNESG